MSDTVRNARGGEFATARRGGVDGYELAFIQQKARQGVPDSAIAKMLGRRVEEITENRETAEIAQGFRVTYSAPRPVPPPPHPMPVVRAPPLKVRPMPERAKRIVWGVCDLYDLTWDEMMSDSRRRHISHPRQHAFWRLSKAGFALADIGRFFGGMDHTTVRHGVIAYEKRLALQGDE